MGETKVVGCCERTAACQLVTTNLVLAVCGVVMMIFSTIILLKVTAGFAIAILSVGGFMILLSIYGCWSSKDSADCRIYLYIVLLCMALLAQVVLAVWYLVNPDIMEDAANKGCETKSSDGDYVCDADCKSCQASVQVRPAALDWSLRMCACTWCWLKNQSCWLGPLSVGCRTSRIMCDLIAQRWRSCCVWCWALRQLRYSPHAANRALPTAGTRSTRVYWRNLAKHSLHYGLDMGPMRRFLPPKAHHIKSEGPTLSTSSRS
eukprot:TRINITY_DN2516_c0_g1_i6.p1 TRINITY_DN2516_c0_g1~~TRINITY_DN2516_c0_g1_i6.p1  ORF type:complete len:262 (-),score=16.27 TRINITY_DN2516_c0_g1_i6:280-1065(-)